MKTLREVLGEADPLRHEPTYRSDLRDVCRQAVLTAVPPASAPSPARSRSRVAILAIVALSGIAASFLGSRVWSPFVSDLQAAVRFEMRLAEDKPGPGLREAKSPEQSLYLHDEVIVTNSDIAAAQVVQGGDPSHYSVAVEFNPSGAEKMRSTTGGHIGKRLAILIDGQVVAAPVLRSPIDGSAVVTGGFSRAKAERIVKGIGVK
jgi:hypothetical protein